MITKFDLIKLLRRNDSFQSSPLCQVPPGRDSPNGFPIGRLEGGESERLVALENSESFIHLGRFSLEFNFLKASGRGSFFESEAICFYTHHMRVKMSKHHAQIRGRIAEQPQYILT